MKDIAVKLAVVRELETRLKDYKAELNLVFLEELDEGDAKVASLDDGTKLGKVSKVSGRRSPKVVNERVFLEWVKQNHPTEVVESVRDSYRQKLLESAKTHGEAVDTTTGEVVPGVELSEGNPYVSFRSERGAGDVISARWRELVSNVLGIEEGNS